MDDVLPPPSGEGLDRDALVRDIATRDVVCLPAERTAGDAAALMWERRISSIVVTDEGGRPAGIITEHNILHAMHAGHPRDVRLGVLMAAPVITVPAATGLLDAYRLCLRQAIRHLVLLEEDGALAGVVSETDFRLHIKLTVLAGRRKVATVARRSAIVLGPSASLCQAMELMLAQGRSCAVVVEEDKPVGIVTERDMVRWYAGGEACEERALHEVMVSPVWSMGRETPISKVAEEMLVREVRHLVVVDEAGRFAGLVAESDLTQAMAGGMVEERDGLEQNFLRTLVNTLPDLVWVKDTEGVYLACNARVERLFGVKEHDIVGKTDYELVDRELADSFREHDHRAMAAGAPSANEEWVSYAEDGHRELLETVKTPMRDRAGRLLGVVGIARDITGRRQAEAELRRLSAALRQSEEPVTLIDTQARYVYVNAAFCRLFGYELHELIGKPISLLMPREDVAGPSVRETVSTARERDRFHGEVWRRAKDGRVVPLLLKVSPLHDERGELTGYVASMTDLTEIKRLEESLRQSERHFRSILEHAPVGMATTTLDGHVLMVNQAFCSMLGYEKDELERLSFADIAHPEDRGLAVPYRRQLLDGEIDNYQLEKRYVRKDGQIVWGLITSSVERDRSGKPLYFITQVEDVTRRKQAEESLRITASVFDTSQEAIVITGADNAIIDVNPAFTRITGYTREEALGRNPRLLSSGRHDKAFYAAMWQSLVQQGSWRGEIWNRRKSGELYAELLSASIVRDKGGKVLRHVAVFSDISRIKEHEIELSRVAHYDALTGVPNRVLLADRMKQAIARTSREGNMMAVCYIDLDGFKPINDTLGHEAGDRVLVEVSRRFEKTIRGGDTVARLGGDEFVILLLGLKRAEECVATLERLLNEAALPMEIDGETAAVGASIGVSIYPQDNEDADTLLRHADQAMYLAKQAGKHRYHIYDPSLDRRARDYNALLRTVRGALALGEFELYYQPKVELATRRLLGVEALLRWRHPRRGLLGPGEFLHVLENSELDVRLGEWVIETALAQQAAWRAGGLDIEVSVNISAHHLESRGFVEMLRGRLAGYGGLPAGRLQVEVLETAALEDVARVSEVIGACRELGVGFALDDFGTGYSSLTYLSRLPVDVLKIDQSFVRDMLEDKGDSAIVHGIVALARAFGRHTVAEGIETQEHYRALLDAGCVYGQGYYIAHPMPAHELASWRPAY